jgi:CO/xanthine dehydrogenase FAD-binding subunit
MDALPEFALVRAATLEEVIGARTRHPDSRLLGGGTDLVVNIRRGILAPPVIIDVNHVAELRAIRADARSLEIGAAVKLAEVAAHQEVMRHYPMLAQAAGFIAGPTHRNMGTVGGNLCLDTRCLFYNQSEWWRAANHHCLKTTGEVCHVAPKSRGVCFATFSGDLAPALLTLNAEVDLAGPAGGSSSRSRTSYRLRAAGSPICGSEGDGKYYLAAAGEFVTAGGRTHRRPAVGLHRCIRRSIECPSRAWRWRCAGKPTCGDLRVAFTAPIRGGAAQGRRSCAADRSVRVCSTGSRRSCATKSCR